MHYLRINRIVLLGALALVLVLGGCSKTRETRLDNGLKVVVQEDHRSPVVVSQIWYTIGGMDEPKGITGVSHVLEHMMFKGTKKYPSGEFSRIIAENGGRENAFTSRDYTAYFQTLEKSRLAIAFELEADRMTNLLLEDKEFRKELKVVMEERRLRTEDKPEGKLYEKFSAAAYTKHPYGNPIIGWMEDLKSLTIEDVRKWYGRWYAPNNATLVVAGDVDPDEVFALAKKYFGSIPAREVTPMSIPVEPKQKTRREIIVKVPAKVPSIIIGFHTPVHGFTDEVWEPYALDVLAGILDGGKSARFSRDLVRAQRIAASASAGYDAIARAPSMFLVSGTPAPGKNIAQLKKALLQQIKRIKEEIITEEELDRVKAQVSASDVYQRDSVFYQAMEIGILEASGLNRDLIDDYVDRINAVTVKQIKKVARKYLLESNMTIAELKPLPFDQKRRPRPAVSGGRHGG
ncbi:MAG: M16 family metallopeptidase [Acidiferrobacterales bacterium]